jgi:hypothetical protein
MEIGVYPVKDKTIGCNYSEVVLSGYNLRRFCNEQQLPLFSLDTALREDKPVRKLFTFYEGIELSATEPRAEH